MKMCDCGKTRCATFNFLMNPGWGYLPPTSLKISAKLNTRIFGYDQKQDFSDNGGHKICDSEKSSHWTLHFFDEFWVGILASMAAMKMFECGKSYHCLLHFL